ncbi:hypothetical protein [Desulfuribacillus stibiiarsenatis]|uniref:hypothetical protein n=1 Tax=Desulfuribacillus stibiiarsenatis TaxID=1390249 RepID=UPI00159F130E|nr:hypothetical protein [Desulfuribacillus stibiiarsenatis]
MKLDDLKGKKVVDYKITNKDEDIRVEIIFENNLYLNINLSNLPVDAITLGKRKG